MGCAESKTERPKYRVCTDVFWLILFGIFWLLLINMLINENILNSEGRNTLEEPNLFFLDVKELRQTIKICVKECPNRQINNRDELYRYYVDTKSQLCRYDFNMSLLLERENPSMKYFNLLGPCPPFPVYESTPVLHRCLPTGKNAPKEMIKNAYKLLNNWDIAQQFLSDLYKTWPIMALLASFALLLSIILVAFMHWLTKIVSWLICIFVVIASIAFTVVLWWAYYSMKQKKDLSVKYSMLEEFLRNETAIYVLAIIATIIMILLIIIVYYLKSKLSGMAALFEEAGKCMLSLPGLAIAPTIAFLFLTIFLAFWVFVVVCIVTANYPGMTPLIPLTSAGKVGIPSNNTALTGSTEKVNSDSDYKTLLKVEYKDASWIKSMLWIYFIGLIWHTEFIFACQQFALAGAVAYWYFKKPTDSPSTYAIGKLLKYHLGSVAKGSFVITIFKIPRLILTYLYTKLKKSEDKGSQCAKCCLTCCICGFWLLEKFIRFLNHNAYTVIAIESINFCPAAGIAWNAMATNALQVATINSIGDFILFLGKVMVATICGLVSVLILKDREDIHFYVAPVVFITIFGFFIAHVVLSLFEVVVDTLFLCVCEDKTINGNAGRWKQSNLAKLVGEEPNDDIEGPIQAVEMTPINKQPFHNIMA
ncbi:choline transporter-like 1 isoform X2 [Condylostylus longicornis]|uniref:choline transporter-like 1 isoform X2 n=2 Tax=Condylostylus longicornis TaxID=2530218 RepID=UPI00244E3C83|nr:choline transporter-like 1 isoform X2 [Condylostylus longicornis]